MEFANIRVRVGASPPLYGVEGLYAAYRTVCSEILK